MNNSSPLSHFINTAAKDLKTRALKVIERFDYIEHYTSAAAALAILRHREIWFTNVANMNDISEILGGCRIVSGALRSEGPKILGSLCDEILTELEQRFAIAYTNTYAFCLSGHDPEQASGRLAMWRSYGADGTGVCLVLKRLPVMQNRQLDFPINWMPMICEKPDDLMNRTVQFLHSCAIELTKSNILETSRPTVIAAIAHTLLTMGIAHKHEQFSYEQELRLIHIKTFQAPIPEMMRYDGEVIRGLLQPIFKVKLSDYSVHGLSGIQMPELLEKILIGPSPAAMMQAKALEHVLAREKLNVPVEICAIPYRSLNQ